MFWLSPWNTYTDLNSVLTTGINQPENTEDTNHKVSPLVVPEVFVEPPVYLCLDVLCAQIWTTTKFDTNRNVLRCNSFGLDLFDFSLSLTNMLIRHTEVWKWKNPPVPKPKATDWEEILVRAKKLSEVLNFLDSWWILQSHLQLKWRNG